MTDCIFCKIVNGEIPGQIVYQDEQIMAFKDINPVAPTHVLIIPKVHIQSLNQVSTEHKDLLGQMMVAVGKIAHDLGIAEGGYRLVSNCGKNGGQTVSHLHFHLLGGRSMQWPPG